MLVVGVVELMAVEWTAGGFKHDAVQLVSHMERISPSAASPDNALPVYVLARTQTHTQTHTDTLGTHCQDQNSLLQSGQD